MSDHIPSIALAVAPADLPEVLRRLPSMEYPVDGNWHPESDAAEDGVFALLNEQFEGGQLWQFTSTNHWHDLILADLAEGLGHRDLSFLRSLYAILGPDALVAAITALSHVIEAMRRSTSDLPLSGNDDREELLGQLPAGDPFAGANVSRDVDEWDEENAFGSFLLSLAAALEEARTEGAVLL